VEKLRERGIAAPEERLAALLARLKDGAERQSKDETTAFIAEYRGRFDRPGISDEEFWRMVDEVGLRPVSA